MVYCKAIFLFRLEAGRVRAVLIEMYYPNDDKEDDNKKDADIEDADKEDDDVHQLITKKKNVKVSTLQLLEVLVHLMVLTFVLLAPMDITKPVILVLRVVQRVDLELD